MPITMCSGLAPSCLKRSSKTFHPCFVLAKSSGLTTTCLLGRQIQPEQDWLPMSIPQTYLITTSGEDDNAVVLIVHLLLLALTGAGPRRSVQLSNFDQQARNPLGQGERQLIVDRQSDQNPWLLQQAS